jgi:copper chaperone CopZ
MKMNKKIKIVAFSLLGLGFLFFATLIVHIAIMVKGRPAPAYATIQMARADFKEPVDSLSAVKIQNNIKNLKGVQSTYFNVKDYIVVYTYDNKVNTAQNIYDLAIRDAGFRSSRYLVSEKDLAKGCPAMNSNSFYGKLTDVVSKIVN